MYQKIIYKNKLLISRKIINFKKRTSFKEDQNEKNIQQVYQFTNDTKPIIHQKRKKNLKQQNLQKFLKVLKIGGKENYISQAKMTMKK